MVNVYKDTCSKNETHLPLKRQLLCKQTAGEVKDHACDENGILKIKVHTAIISTGLLTPVQLNQCTLSFMRITRKVLRR